MGKSLYDILNIEEEATVSGIKNAYVRLKNQYEQRHPETDPQHISQIQYRAIEEAYSILSDSKRRDLYDQKLVTDRQQAYLVDTQPRKSPYLRITFALLAITLSGIGYMHYRHVEAERVREQLRIQLEQEQLKVRQEELRLEAEKAAQAREEMAAQQQEAYQREKLIADSRIDSRLYARQIAQEEEKARRLKLEAQREQARQEALRQRYERMRPVGPTYIRR